MLYEYQGDKIVIAICLTSILCLMDQNFSPTHYLLPVFEYSPYLKLKDLKKEKGKDCAVVGLVVKACHTLPTGRGFETRWFESTPRSGIRATGYPFAPRSRTTVHLVGPREA